MVRIVQYKLNIMKDAAENRAGLGELESEVITLFVRMADVLNLPRGEPPEANIIAWTLRESSGPAAKLTVKPR